MDIRRLYVDSVESDTSYGDFAVKLVWRLSRSLIYHVSSLTDPEKLHNFYMLLRQPNFLSVPENRYNLPKYITDFR